MRFPGQYYDAESKLANNVSRDYDAPIGRYIQSDPLGLSAGSSTYGYVGGNPLLTIDPLGLNYAASWAAQGAVIGGGTVAVLSLAADYATGGLNVLATPAEIGAGAAGGAAFFGALGGVVDHVVSSKSKDDAPPSNVVRFPGSKVRTWQECPPDPDEQDPQEKRYQALKQSVLATCASLSGKKRMQCLDSANVVFRQCMGYE